MNQKILCLIIIAMFALSALPMTFAAEPQSATSAKLTTKVDPETIPLFSDMINVQSSVSNGDSQIISRAGRPGSQPKTYSLFIEIDYMTGHRPTDEVTTYITNYYLQRGIQVTIKIDEEVSIDASVSDDEFWNLEATYNQGIDRANYNPTFELSKLNQKWVLFGTAVENGDGTIDTKTLGYTICWGNFRDLVSGNWIFVADKIR